MFRAHVFRPLAREWREIEAPAHFLGLPAEPFVRTPVLPAVVAQARRAELGNARHVEQEIDREIAIGRAGKFVNGRNAEIRAWVEEHPEIKERIEAKIRNVPAQNRERAFINAAKTESMNQTVRRNGNGIRA